jgi:hypothetical protein
MALAGSAKRSWYPDGFGALGNLPFPICWQVRTYFTMPLRSCLRGSPVGPQAVGDFLTTRDKLRLRVASKYYLHAASALIRCITVRDQPGTDACRIPFPLLSSIGTTGARGGDGLGAPHQHPDNPYIARGYRLDACPRQCPGEHIIRAPGRFLTPSTP